MTIKEHKRVHEELHKKLEELIADFIHHEKKGLSKTSIMELLEWSFKQTFTPTEED